jgi:YfiH family protein
MLDGPEVEVVAELSGTGSLAFTTTRAAGSFGLSTSEPARDVLGRWMRLMETTGGPEMRLAWAHQVHGTQIIEHRTGWSGWLRCPEGDGHLAVGVPTAMAVTLADCVPVFIAHPGGAAAVLHAGWRGTAGAITRRAIARLAALGCPPDELVVHCGPAICGRCYVVGPDVYEQLTGTRIAEPAAVDLRALILQQAMTEGVRTVSASSSCTRCDNARFFSHRAGDSGRQLGVIVTASSAPRSSHA